MKRVLAIFLGILTAIGGFVDMGDLVANAATGARFELNLAWVVVVGVIGIVVYAEMAGRVAAVSQRAVFDLVRERLGPRFGLVNLMASFFINLLTLTAELAGVAIAISLVASVSYLFLIPVVAFLVWLVVWRMPFETMERVFSLLGLCLLVFVVAVWKLGPEWGDLLSSAASPHVPADETAFTYFFFAIALFGAAMTTYEVFFFPSGAVEDGWTERDLRTNRPTSSSGSRSAAGFRVDRLVVGRGSLAHRLGYERGGVRGPWLVRALFAWRERRGQSVAWVDVVGRDEASGTLVVRTGAIGGST